ncbi:MAG: MBL fold metallo-hydrolase [Treponema sp.]|nr:MBL fold metallo-hydrolase [Treponema sp.]
MKMTILGSGTSHGVPVIACDCKVCTSVDSRDKRMRASAFVQNSDASLVIDTGPEFRMQALRFNIKKLDSVLVTHSHADHLNGLDDVRIFSHTKSVDPSNPDSKETEGLGIPVYANTVTIRDTKNRFDYIFMPVKEGGGKPKIHLEDTASFSAENPIRTNSICAIPVPIMHGHLECNGYLLYEDAPLQKRKSIAYLTDCSAIPQETFDLIAKKAGTLEHLVIDGLREKPHSTHFSFEQALEAANILAPHHTWLTHITHNKSHTEIQEYIGSVLQKFPALNEIVKSGGSVEPAYDGLEIFCS